MFAPAARLSRSSVVAKSRTVQFRLLPSVVEGGVLALTQGACQLPKLNQQSCFLSAFPFSSP